MSQPIARVFFVLYATPNVSQRRDREKPINMGVWFAACCITYDAVYRILGFSKDATVDVSPRCIISHLFLLNDLVGIKWYNGVYWTLAIEFQWYLLAGLLFPLLVARRPWIPVGTLIGMALASLTLPGEHTLPENLLPFAFGIAVFEYSIGRFSKAGLAAVLVGLAVASQKLLGRSQRRPRLSPQYLLDTPAFNGLP